MAHTPKQRDSNALCAAKKKNGQLCRAFAGQGTNHPGVGRCKFHLGNAPNHEKHAVVQEARARLAKADFGEAHEVDPATALLGVLHLSAGHLNFVRAELAEIEDKRSMEGQVLMRLWDEERDRIARISKMALDAGVAEQQIKLAEMYGAAIADLLNGIFRDPDLALTAAQHAKLGDVVRRHLAAVATEERPALVA